MEKGARPHWKNGAEHKQCYSGKPHSSVPPTEAVQVSVDIVSIVRLIFRESVYTAKPS